MHFDVKGFKIITLRSNFQFFSQYFTQKKEKEKRLNIDHICIEYENNVISRYIEDVHRAK